MHAKRCRCSREKQKPGDLTCGKARTYVLTSVLSCMQLSHDHCQSLQRYSMIAHPFDRMRSENVMHAILQPLGIPSVFIQVIHQFRDFYSSLDAHFIRPLSCASSSEASLSWPANAWHDRARPLRVAHPLACARKGSFRSMRPENPAHAAAASARVALASCCDWLTSSSMAWLACMPTHMTHDYHYSFTVFLPRGKVRRQTSCM